MSKSSHHVEFNVQTPELEGALSWPGVCSPLQFHLSPRYLLTLHSPATLNPAIPPLVMLPLTSALCTHSCLCLKLIPQPRPLTHPRPSMSSSFLTQSKCRHFHEPSMTLSPHPKPGLGTLLYVHRPALLAAWSHYVECITLLCVPINRPWAPQGQEPIFLVSHPVSSTVRAQWNEIHSRDWTDLGSGKNIYTYINLYI